MITLASRTGAVASSTRSDALDRICRTFRGAPRMNQCDVAQDIECLRQSYDTLQTGRILRVNRQDLEGIAYNARSNHIVHGENRLSATVYQETHRGPHIRKSIRAPLAWSQGASRIGMANGPAPRSIQPPLQSHYSRLCPYSRHHRFRCFTCRSRSAVKRPNATQEQTGGCCRGSAPPAPRAFRKPCVSGASEDFVPPAAQRRLVRLP